MQNRYVGDVGDFANNGLLRWLTGMTGPALSDEERLRLGVVWYLNEPSPKESGNRDGKRVSYLCNSLICGPENLRDYRECDPYLYDRLKLIVGQGVRDVVTVRQLKILPEDTDYYDTQLNLQTDRTKWLEGALDKTAEAHIVFVDPDKGIHSDKKLPDTKASHEHVYMDELKPFVDRCQSLVIYNHLDHSGNVGKAKDQIKNLSNRLQSELCNPAVRVHALWYHREIARFYFIVAHPDHKDDIKERLESFRNKENPWCVDRRPHFKEPHFTMHDQNGNPLPLPECSP